MSFSGQDNGSNQFHFVPSDRNGFNNQGQVAFAFRLANDSRGIALVNTDGTTVELDYGDAPDSYGVRLTSGGARHIATGPMLGSQRDSDADGQPTAGANGDDNAQTSDEDGILQTEKRG